MKLRTRLLLGVGILLFAMVVVMYILPTYFVRKDVYKAADQIEELLLEEHQELVKSQELWLRDEINQITENIDSILFMLNEDSALATSLDFSADKSGISVWNGIARVSGYDPEIGFIQAHAPSLNQTALISPHSATLYPTKKIATKGGYEFLLTQASLEVPEGKNKVYAGLLLPKGMQTEPDYTFYALMDPQDVQEEQTEIQKEIERIASSMHEKYRKIPLQDYQNAGSSGYFWAIKVGMIRTLAPLYVEGLALKHTDEKFVPEGLARLDSSGNGLSILTDEAFQATPLFDDEKYYESHPPAPNTPKLAKGYVLVTEEVGNHAFIANTLLINKTFISIGFPLSRLVQQLALSSNKMILLRVKENFWIGFNGQGEKMSPSLISSLAKSGLFDLKQGMVTINQKNYLFNQIHSFDKGNLVFFQLHPSAGEKSIISTLMKLEDRLSERISLQLSLISIGTMVLVLLFIGRIGLTVIQPITKLAQETEHIVEGRYEEVRLPDPGKRKDEVATLIRSFGSMVKGLEEREKIRGVLDKVVSKDVADEILRTQIHLGGEDRIVTMLFSDIRGFSEITENVTPQKTIQMLNGCMTKISRVIEGEGGVIDKYVGDEVMAIFGAPNSHPDHALRAVSSGMLMIETLKRWNEERARDGEPVIEMGIGIHTGLVVAGNMGAEDRLNYTVLGASVNLAARLCEVAKRNQLIISQATLEEPNIKDSFHVEPLEPIVLKGFSEPVSIYEVLGFKWDVS